MAITNPTDLDQVKRGTTLSFPVMTQGEDHWRLKVYRLDADGVEALTYTSDKFFIIPPDIILYRPLLVAAVDDPAGFEFAAVDNKYYKVVTYWYPDAIESAENKYDEDYIHIFPDEIESQETSGSLSTALFNRLMWMLGNNVLDGEFENPAGYTQARTRRGYNSLSEVEADALLTASDVPTNTNVVLSTFDNGNENTSREVEEDVS